MGRSASKSVTAQQEPGDMKCVCVCVCVCVFVGGRERKKSARD